MTDYRYEYQRKREYFIKEALFYYWVLTHENFNLFVIWSLDVLTEVEKQSEYYTNSYLKLNINLTAPTENWITITVKHSNIIPVV